MRSRGQARPGLTTRVRPQQAGPGSRAAGNNPPRRPEHAPHPGFRRGDVEATRSAFSLPVATVSGNAAGELLDILLEPTRDRVTGIPFYSRVADAQDSYLPPIAVQSGPAVIVIRIVGSKDRTARTALLLLLTLSRAPGYARIERTTRSGPLRCTMGRIARFQAAAAMSSDSPRLAGLRAGLTGRCRDDAGACPPRSSARRRDRSPRMTLRRFCATLTSAHAPDVARR